MKLVLKKTTIDIKFENFVETDITSQMTSSAGYWYGAVGNPIEQTDSSGVKYAPVNLSQYVGHKVFVNWSGASSAGRYTCMCDAATKVALRYTEGEVTGSGGKTIEITAEAPYLYLSTSTSATGLSVIVKD